MAASTGNMSIDEMLRLAFYLLKDNPMCSDCARKYEELVRETAIHAKKEKT